MPWVKLDDRFADHPKFHQSGHLYPLLLALQVVALCEAAKALSDGHLPRRKAMALAGLVADGVTVHDDNGDPLDMTAALLVQAMVDAGLWDKVPGGYAVHDYRDYQPTKAQVEREREGSRQRMQAMRERQRYGVTPDVTNGEVTGAVPGTGTGNNLESSAEPVPNFWQPGNEGTDDPFVALHGMTGRVPTGRGAEWINEMARDHGDRAVTTELARQWGDDPNERTLLRRTIEALKLAAVVKNRAKPQAPDPEPRRPATPEELHRAKVQRRAVRLWMEAGGPGSGKTVDEFMEQAEKEVPRARTDGD